MYTSVKLNEKYFEGGVSLISHPHAVANNEMMGEKFCSEKEKTYLILLDSNNLYGGTLMTPLPVGNYKWVENVSNIHIDDDINLWVNHIMQIADDASEGYFFQVDLEYPDTLHNNHDDYPLCPIKMQIERHRLSQYQQNLSDKLDVNLNGSEKLCLTLDDKVKYICHYTSLKLYLSLGLKLKKIHKILKFKQHAWAREYVCLNTFLRKNASSDFEEALSKFQNNNMYGKTIENVIEKSKSIVTNSEKKVQRYLKMNVLKDFDIIRKNLIFMSFEKKAVLLNKPRAVGSTVLEKAKNTMYNFHYNVMKKMFPNIQLLLTDTDSLLYLVQSDTNIYETLKKHEQHFDFSNYDVNHVNYNDFNKLTPLKFKDEFGGKIITEFVGLRSKLYSLKTKDGFEKKTSKGTLKNITKNELIHNDYKQSLFDETMYYNEGVKIIHENNKMYTVNLKKNSLCPYNDKKFVTKNFDSTFTTKSFGHFQLSLSNNQSYSFLKK